MTDQSTHSSAAAGSLGTRSAELDPGSAPGEAATFPALLRQLVDDLATLFRKELALASSEVRQSIDDARKGAGALATGGLVLYAGFLFLLLAITAGLAESMSPWVAALLVGAVVTVVGFCHGQSRQEEGVGRQFRSGSSRCRPPEGQGRSQETNAMTSHIDDLKQTFARIRMCSSKSRSRPG